VSSVGRGGSGSSGSISRLRQILDFLKSSPSCKLADKTRRELPSFERVETTFRNINWLLLYWMCEAPLMLPSPSSEEGWDYSVCYPDPISPEYGFAAVTTGKGSNKKMVVKWMDDDYEHKEDD
jgi:hypothetical protein